MACSGFVGHAFGAMTDGPVDGEGWLSSRAAGRSQHRVGDTEEKTSDDHAFAVRKSAPERQTMIESTNGGSAPRLALVKGVHTAVFWLELGSIVWLVVTGIVGRRDRTVAVAAALVAAEAAVWVANDRICPLTPLAERYGAVSGSVSDIWLPGPVARTIPQWSTALLVLAGLLHLRAARRSSTRS